MLKYAPDVKKYLPSAWTPRIPVDGPSQLSMNAAPAAAALKHGRRCIAFCLFNFSFSHCDALTFFLLLLCKHCVALIISLESSKNNNLQCSAWPGATGVSLEQTVIHCATLLNQNVYITRLAPRGGVGRAGVFLQHLKL